MFSFDDVIMTWTKWTRSADMYIDSDKHVIYFAHKHYKYLTDHYVKESYWYLTSRITFSNINYVACCFTDNGQLCARPPIYEYTSENNSLSQIT